MSHDVCVLGSANLDLVYDVDHIPSPGETILASGQARHPGGKGLNQAVAASRSGATTVFVGAVGQDEAGDVLLATMREAGIDTSLVRRSNVDSGTALITVSSDGENAIVVATGANGTVESLNDAERTTVAQAEVLVCQLEVPLSVVEEAIAVAREKGTTVVLNAAPAQELPDSLLSSVDVLVVNEGEAAVLGLVEEVGDLDKLDRRGAGAVVVTRGEHGATAYVGQWSEHVPAPEADVVDTTGAGDTFTGVLASALAHGALLSDAVKRGVYAGTISVESPGAVPSIPTREAVDARLPQQP